MHLRTQLGSRRLVQGRFEAESLAIQGSEFDRSVPLDCFRERLSSKGVDYPNGSVEMRGWPRIKTSTGIAESLDAGLNVQGIGSRGP